MRTSETTITDRAAPARVASVERELPRALPNDYRTFLGGERPSFPALGPWDAGWEQTVAGFQREWQPLGGNLFPVEHCGDGIFACLLLGCAAPYPVVAWDVAADLGEQPTVWLAPSWATYVEGRTTPAGEPDQGPVLDPLSDATRTIELRRRLAENDLNTRIRAFEQVEQHFNEAYARAHEGNRFEHHVDHGQVRGTDWRPERFAVQDHLLGVVASRYDKGRNTIDIVGFATRDHTNYARGSATAGLLVGLLCDCAAKAASGLRFFTAVPQTSRDEPLGVVPNEVVVLAGVLGVDVDPRSAVIPADAAGRLLLELTPFHPHVRRALADSGINLLRLCLAVHKQVWSPLETALLARWCPEADGMLGGEIDAGEMVRLASALHHGVAAVLASFGAVLVETAAEIAQAGSCRFDLTDRRYSLACRPTAPTSWTDAVDGSTIDVAPGREIFIAGVPLDEIRSDVVDRFDDEIQRMSGLKLDGLVLAVVPHRARVARHGRRTRFVSADLDAADLETQVHQRLRKGRRIRS